MNAYSRQGSSVDRMRHDVMFSVPRVNVLPELLQHAAPETRSRCDVRRQNIITHAPKACRAIAVTLTGPLNK